MLRNKNVVKILSVLVAVILWVYVIGVQNPPTTQTVQNIPIQLLNTGALARNGLAVLETSRQTVNVVVRGTRADIAQYQDQLTAVVDVLTDHSGERYIQVMVPPLSRLTIEEVRPANVLVKIENLVSVYKPLNIIFTGDVEPNTEPGRMTIQPEQVRITGPQSRVEAVYDVRAYVPYNEISRAGSIFSLPVSVVDVYGEPVPGLELSSERVSVDVLLYDTKEVPLSVEIIGEISELYEITALDVPQTIRIKGTRTALANVNAIQAEPVNISNVQMTSSLPVRPILPEGIELARGFANLRVNISVRGISRSSFEYSASEIDIQGLSAELHAHIDTQMVTLSAAGSEAVIGAMEQEDFTLSVDLQGLGEGDHIVPVIVEHDQELNHLEVTPGEVQITITARE